MPQAKPLTGKTGQGKSGMKAPMKKETITVADVATVNPTTLTEAKAPANLAKLTGAVRIPAFLQKATLPDIAMGGGVDYVGFCETQSKNYSVMVHNGLEAGDPFALVDNQYKKLLPMEFFLLEQMSFRVAMIGKQGRFCFVTQDLVTPLSQLAEDTGNQFALKAEPFYSSLIAVKIENALVPIKADFKGTKADAGRIPNLAVKEAETADWLKRGNEYRITAAVPQAFLRVWNSVTTFYKQSKSTGNDCYPAKCRSTPATVEQMELGLKAFTDDNFLIRLEKAKAQFDSRNETLIRFVTEPEEAID